MNSFALIKGPSGTGRALESDQLASVAALGLKPLSEGPTKEYFDGWSTNQSQHSFSSDAETASGSQSMLRHIEYVIHPRIAELQTFQCDYRIGNNVHTIEEWRLHTHGWDGVFIYKEVKR